MITAADHDNFHRKVTELLDGAAIGAPTHKSDRNSGKNPWVSWGSPIEFDQDQEAYPFISLTEEPPNGPRYSLTYEHWPIWGTGGSEGYWELEGFFNDFGSELTQPWPTTPELDRMLRNRHERLEGEHVNDSGEYPPLRPEQKRDRGERLLNGFSNECYLAGLTETRIIKKSDTNPDPNPKLIFSRAEPCYAFIMVDIEKWQLILELDDHVPRPGSTRIDLYELLYTWDDIDEVLKRFAADWINSIKSQIRDNRKACVTALLKSFSDKAQRKQLSVTLEETQIVFGAAQVIKVDLDTWIMTYTNEQDYSIQVGLKDILQTPNYAPVVAHDHDLWLEDIRRRTAEWDLCKDAK